jgi:hypothetical protein
VAADSYWRVVRAQLSRQEWKRIRNFYVESDQVRIEDRVARRKKGFNRGEITYRGKSSAFTAIRSIARARRIASLP